CVGIEAGCQHEHVQLVQLTVTGHDATRLDPFDRLGNYVNVRTLHGSVELPRYREALAARLVVRRQLAPQIGVAHGLEVQPAGQREGSALPSGPNDGDGEA